MTLNINGLEDQWRDDSPDHPPCAICKKQIGSEMDDLLDGLSGTPDIPLRIWRPHPDPDRPEEKQEMAFHFACAEPRLVHQIHDN